MAKKELQTGFYQALTVVFYCSLVGSVIWNGEKIFGQMKSFIGPITFLTMFSVSALICGLLVFYKPYKLFFANKKEEAANIVVATTVSLFTILLILFLVMYFVK